MPIVEWGSTLADRLVGAGILTREHAAAAVHEARRTGQSVGHVLVEAGYCAEEDLVAAIAGWFGMIYVDLRAFPVSAAAVDLIDAATARRLRAMPIRTENQVLIVAAADPSRVPLTLLEQQTGLRIHLAIATEAALDAALDRWYPVSGSPPPGPPPGEVVTAALLFTDIVDSTKWADELGMAQWRDLLSHHHVAVRKAIERHGGLDVNTWGDAFFARFLDAAASVECAKSAVQAVAALGVEIRAGVHVGRVELHERQVIGLEVHVAARVAAAAGASEVLVTDAVRRAVPDIEVLDRGTHHLKGLSEPQALYSLA